MSFNLDNPNDPLRQGPVFQLLEGYSRASEGRTTDDVILAAAGLLVNALRQSCTTRQAAEKSWDELAAKTKALLLDHYGTDGRRRNVFPFTQTIEAPFVVNNPKVNNG